MSETVINDGGPAFARSSFIGEVGDLEAAAQDGMTLRDYFAAAALQGMVAKPDFTIDIAGEIPAIQRAGVCYMIADAMLAAREKSS